MLYMFDKYTSTWYVSTDTGTSWAAIAGTNANDSRDQAMATTSGFFIWNSTGLYVAPLGSSTAQRAGLGRGLGTTFSFGCSTCAKYGLAVHIESGTTLTVGPSRYESTQTVGWRNPSPATKPWSSIFASAVMAQSPKNTDRWYYSDNGGIYVSNDNGSSSAFVHNLPYGLQPNQLVVSSTNADLVYAATGQGIYKSSDAGASWQWASTNLEHTYIKALSIDPTNDQVLYAATHVGVYATADGGGTWTLASDPLDINAIEIQRLAITSDGTTLFGATNDHGVVRSLDKAMTWEWDDTGLTTYTTSDVAIDPTDGNVVYLATNTGVWKSTDKGSSWIRASHTLPYPGTHQLGISQDGQHIYAITDSPLGTALFAGTPSSDTGAGFATSGIPNK